MSFSLPVAVVSGPSFRLAFTYLNETWWQASIWSVTSTHQVRLSSWLPYFFMSYCPLFKICLSDFSCLCFQISEWIVIASFRVKSYTSSLTFVTIDLLFHELLPSVQNSFSGPFLVMFLHIGMKVGSKLPNEELQFKCDFYHGWSTFVSPAKQSDTEGSLCPASFCPSDCPSVFVSVRTSHFLGNHT